MALLLQPNGTVHWCRLTLRSSRHAPGCALRMRLNSNVGPRRLLSSVSASRFAHTAVSPAPAFRVSPASPPSLTPVPAVAFPCASRLSYAARVMSGRFPLRLAPPAPGSSACPGLASLALGRPLSLGGAPGIACGRSFPGAGRRGHRLVGAEGSPPSSVRCLGGCVLPAVALRRVVAWASPPIRRPRSAGRRGRRIASADSSPALVAGCLPGFVCSMGRSGALACRRLRVADRQGRRITRPNPAFKRSFAIMPAKPA